MRVHKFEKSLTANNRSELLKRYNEITGVHHSYAYNVTEKYGFIVGKNEAGEGVFINKFRIFEGSYIINKHYLNDKQIQAINDFMNLIQEETK